MTETCPTCNAIRTTKANRRVVFACGAILDDGRQTKPCGRAEPAELPPDVIGLLLNGKNVEIAEPRKRFPKKGDVYLYAAFSRPQVAFVDHGSSVDVEEWILRIKEQPPLSVYGCDPKSVDLSQLRGPNGRPVEWVDFREPVDGELGVLLGDEDGCGLIVRKYGVGDVMMSSYSTDKRRIIVREVEEPPDVSDKAHGWKKVQHLNPPVKRLPKCGELCLDGGAVTEAREEWPADRPCWILREIEERKPRRFLIQECEPAAAFSTIRLDKFGAGATIKAPRPLADLDDPKVRDAVGVASRKAFNDSIQPFCDALEETGIAAIEAYLALPAVRDGRAGQ